MAKLTTRLHSIDTRILCVCNKTGHLAKVCQSKKDAHTNKRQLSKHMHVVTEQFFIICETVEVTRSSHSAVLQCNIILKPCYCIVMQCCHNSCIVNIVMCQCDYTCEKGSHICTHLFNLDTKFSLCLIYRLAGLIYYDYTYMAEIFSLIAYRYSKMKFLRS